MERKRLNISEIIVSPVLKGTNDKYVWTGVIRSDKITPYIINDDKKRENFTRIVKQYEQLIEEYRRESRGVRGPLVTRAKTPQEMMELERKIGEIGNQIRNMIGNPDEHDIDMELFYVEVCRDYEEIKANNPDELKHMTRSARKTLEEFEDFVNSEATIREIYSDEENKYYAYQFLTHKQEKTMAKNYDEAPGMLVKVLESIAGKEDLSKEEGTKILKELAAPITLIDLQELFPNKRFAEVEYVIVFKNYLLNKGMSQEEIQAMGMDEIVEKAMDTYNKDTIDFHSTLMADAIISGIRYVDVEKFLLLYMHRTLEAYDLMVPKVEETDEEILELDVVKEMKKLEEDADELADRFIRQEASIDAVLDNTRRADYVMRKILDTGIISKRTRFNSRLEDDQSEVSLKTIEARREKFCDGIYLTDIIKSNLVYKAFIKPEELGTWSDELLSRMTLSYNDIKILSLINLDNMKRFYELGILSKENIGYILGSAGSEERARDGIEENSDILEMNRRELMLSNAKEMLKYLYTNGIITTEDIGEYFEGNGITVQDIIRLEESLPEDDRKGLVEGLAKEFDEEMMLERYKYYIETYVELTELQKNDPDNTEAIEELRKKLNFFRKEKEDARELFSRYHVIPEEEKNEFGNDLLDLYYVGFNIDDETVLKESLKELYDDGFIGLDNIAYLDPDYIIPLLDKLTLEDASKIKAGISYEKLTEMFDKIFDEPTFTDERRFIAVMNFFGDDTKEDSEAREFYLAMLDNDAKEKRGRKTGVTRGPGDGTSLPSNKYVYPDFVKWKFYKALDKDVRVTRYANGFVEFASSKLDSRIIEKYYDGNKPAYGTATYILSEDEYRRNVGDLVTIDYKGNILESAALREITPRQDRVAHRTQSADRTWMHDMSRYFGIDLERMQDSRYSSEELEELKAVLEKYKTEYEMIM